MSDQATGVTDESEIEGMPGQGLRTLISFLLFLHLFAIFAVISGNFAAEWRSGLRRELLSKAPAIQWYMQLLGMNTAFDFNPVYGTSEDWDHWCDILLDVPRDFGNTTEEIDQLTKIELMPADAWPATRRRRYSMLSLQAGMLEGDEALESLLPQALAGGILRKHGIDEGTHRFRCRAQAAVPMLRYDTMDPELRNPNHPNYFSDVYQASLLKTDEGWNLTKESGRGEMTQSRSRSTGNSQGSNQ